jgi:hypothetical protein
LSSNWKRFVNEEPVEPELMFEIIEENVAATPAVTDVGETEPAVRSG